MLQNRLTLLIHSCEKYSDLWDANVSLLNVNWSDRGIDTIIATDSKSDKRYPGITIISCGDGKELSERIANVLSLIKTEYVLVTLDDYFLTKRIDSNQIERLVEIMEAESLDYMRLYHRPRKRLTPSRYKNVFYYDMRGDYVVNLYAGLWRKSFIEKTVAERLNAWEYEVKLSSIAREVDAKCMVSLGGEFPILDVVRKGRILNRANLYLKRHKLYKGDRPVMPLISELWLGCKTWLNRLFGKLIPTDLYNQMKRKLGIKSYSANA